MDGDIFENAPRVEANLFENGSKKMRFQNIRILVDGALMELLR